MKIVTHNGRFHADELLAIAALLLKHPEATVVRSRDENIIASADIVVDVGHLYNPAKLRFDHHQTAGADKRANGISYASFGLIWKEFGEGLSGGSQEAEIVEGKLVMAVDAIDNGIDLSMPIFKGIREYTIGDYLESFEEGAETLEAFDQGFTKALPLALDLLKREITSAKRTVSDWKEVQQIYEKAENKKIIILSGNKHWKHILIPTEAVFVVHSRADGLWGVRAVPKSAESYAIKKPLPASWAGLGEKSLAEVSKVKDAVFCHRDLWLANARTKEGALKLAEIALNS